MASPSSANPGYCSLTIPENGIGFGITLNICDDNGGNRRGDTIEDPIYINEDESGWFHHEETKDWEDLCFGIDSATKSPKVRRCSSSDEESDNRDEDSDENEFSSDEDSDGYLKDKYGLDVSELAKGRDHKEDEDPRMPTYYHLRPKKRTSRSTKKHKSQSAYSRGSSSKRSRKNH